MGGRGASANTPNGGGGDIKIVSSEGVWEYGAKSSSNEAFRSDVIKTIENGLRQLGLNPSTLKTAIVAKLKGDNSTMAWHGTNGELGINESYADQGKMQAAYDNCVKQGFHPGRGNKSATEAVISHELGHALVHQAWIKQGANQSYDKMAERIVKDANKKLTGRRNGTRKLSAKISIYAKKSNHETVAESVADVYCNGANAKAESKAVFEALKTYL